MTSSLLSLQKLLNKYIKNNLIKNILINRIVLDSRKIKGKNCLFVALKGHKNNGRNFIKDAILNGAIAILAYSDNKISSSRIIFKNKIPIIYLFNLNKYISYFAGLLYDHPSKKIPVIGITGTNGKTSITHFLMQWIKLLGGNPAVLSTIGNGFSNKLTQTKNTTDSAIKIQSTLKNFVKKKANIIIMEISSHGLKQYRVYDIFFTIGIFTNLTRDHLDYHHNMNNYELSKWSFFSTHKVKKKIINIDDNIGFKWFKKLSDVITVTTKKKLYKSNIFIYIKKITYLSDQTIILFNSSWGNGKIKINLIGKFNVINIILSMAALLSLNYPLQKLLKTASKIKPVKGRMEKIFFKKKYSNIIIDYAHSPDSLKNILLTIRLITYGKIWCIFGCGGERDIGKRKIMGYIATKYAENVILTTDNPRTENINNIIKDIKKGCNISSNIYIIIDRIKAISYAIYNASKKDTILVAGKGHENYQIIGNKILNYSDFHTIQNILKNKYE
ncbi:UDP-N-acetylmuramoyl-L-alanyl-D-glutamate--2,6-diaminopimelate ligase [Enterobacteriaceae endosymbiont of Donacia bicoloricornis]|uniref:UDP-N-acetylmuramoyl-L-alanyl-D-glutamate--2, 6-diaminopimelate ligase n=1 Tax=Enterobacteriaceae endosymbiont of Donacia bicoloricornis TaxID=2675772 RepID=UPI001448EA6C|nr:UDP-N-acetylmuramoyl-L-alanyl-D-glutamate--2,6-diaminopimelate ligase [Enterobacteriaceae endosymbiont of Donacia bicoloricornis]QJC37673.1 UDP-N-acetylmuramoyl-L-alanyl-D-glutamate--2,6-diaminopimelate ligase [Enterobacteriaceae endosymbiont of Donacia bicoloricornis]